MPVEFAEAVPDTVTVILAEAVPVAAEVAFPAFVPVPVTCAEAVPVPVPVCDPELDAVVVTVVCVVVEVVELVTVVVDPTFVYVSVFVQLAGTLPKYIPFLPIPEKSQRPVCPTRRQERLPSSQSAPTSLYRAAFSPGRACMDSAVSKTTRTFGFRVSTMLFTVCKS